MKRLLLLLWLPSVAFSAVMYTPPDTAGRVGYLDPIYAGESSWYSLWTDSLAAPKTNSLGATTQSTVTLPGAALAVTSVVSSSNGALASYEAPAAIAANPEPGTWGLLTLGIVSVLVTLYRRRTAQYSS